MIGVVIVIDGGQTIEQEKIMPHVIVKLWPGKSEAQKQELTARITEAVTSVLGYGDKSVSVALQEVQSKDWAEKVYQPDILECPGKLYKKPGYTM